MRFAFHFLLALSFGTVCVAQNIMVSGTVVDANTMQPLPGATILEEGTNNGVTTDFDGNYSLNVSKGGTLIFNFVSYQSQRVIVGDANVINVSLSNDALEEVIVVGYGTQKRSNVVGSVATVDVEKATQIPTTNVTEFLRGRAAGVQVNLGDARPGGFSNIVIRGNVSVAGGNAPLIIVDGLPYDNLNDISPNDIASLEILKDAASTAIYGARHLTELYW